MYRILQEDGATRERRDQLIHPAYQKPELLATAPNQLWSWDITKLRGPAKWPEWQASGAAGRRPAIPAPGSALGSHPCVATILRPGEASIAGMRGLGPLKSKTSCRGGLGRGTTTSGPGRGPMAGFEVTLYGRICGDHRGSLGK
jgi:hypothetical protein